MRAQKSIVNQVTLGLMETFIKINQEYYFHNRIQSNVRRKQAQSEISNTEYYHYSINELLNNRYVIKSSIGKGSFGEVVLALDNVENRQVAIKIIRSGDLFLQQSKNEIQLYQLLQEQDSPDRRYIVQLLDLHYNLFDILRFNNFVGFNIHHVQRIAYQLFCALRYIHSDCNKIIHCDVKPENILLSAFEGSDIKLIDFGSSSHMGSCFFSYIQSRYYRAPEVILGLPYTSSIDMWSVACVLYEICTGEPLFRGRNELEQLILISSLLGDPPMSMLIKGKKVEDFYLRTRVRDDGNSRYIRRVSSQHIPESMYHNPQSLLACADVSSEDYELYYELVQLLWQLLCWDSSKRLTAEQALNSRFFKVGSIALSLTTDQSPILIQGKQPVSNPERSCESLSSFFQQNNLPRPTLSPGPKLQHPTETPPTPVAELDPSSLSVDPCCHNSLVHKHKRLHSAPIYRMESVSIAPVMSNGPERSRISPRPKSVAYTQMLPHSNSTRVVETPDIVLSKVVNPEDYRTPPLVTKSLQEDQLSRSPILYTPKVSSLSTKGERSAIMRPPAFNDVNASSPPHDTILTPESAPLSNTDYLPVNVSMSSSILSPLVARSGVDRTVGRIQEGRTQERSLSAIFLSSPQLQPSFNPTLSYWLVF